LIAKVGLAIGVFSVFVERFMTVFRGFGLVIKRSDAGGLAVFGWVAVDLGTAGLTTIRLVVVGFGSVTALRFFV